MSTMTPVNEPTFSLTLDEDELVVVWTALQQYVDNSEDVETEGLDIALAVALIAQISAHFVYKESK